MMKVFGMLYLNPVLLHLWAGQNNLFLDLNVYYLNCVFRKEAGTCVTYSRERADVKQGGSLELMSISSLEMIPKC